MIDPNDRALVTELLARYAEAIDSGDFDAVGAMFADAAILNPDGNTIAAGATEVTRLYESMTRRHYDGTPKTAHLVTNVILDQVGYDEIEVRSRFAVFQATDEVQLQPIVVGRYVDRVGFGAHGWQFVSRKMIPELWGNVSDHLHSGIPAGV